MYSVGFIITGQCTRLACVSRTVRWHKTTLTSARLGEALINIIDLRRGDTAKREGKITLECTLVQAHSIVHIASV